MDKLLTRWGQIVFLQATITDRQITVNPIPAFIWVCAAAKGGQIQKSMFVLLSGNVFIMLWRIECGGQDKTESCRHPTSSSSSSSRSSPYLAVCRRKALSFFASAHTWRRQPCTHNKHTNSNTRKHTHPPAMYIFHALGLSDFYCQTHSKQNTHRLKQEINLRWRWIIEISINEVIKMGQLVGITLKSQRTPNIDGVCNICLFLFIHSLCVHKDVPRLEGGRLWTLRVKSEGAKTKVDGRRHENPI